MFEGCHSPHEVARLLRHRYGLPVQLLAGRPTITTGSIIGAIVMPPELGRKVLAQLNRNHAAPVIADPAERTWTFLVAPPSPARPVEVPARRCLAGHGVTVVPGGRMPPRSAVIDAVHEVIGLRAH
jgi:hypothetical protein